MANKANKTFKELRLYFDGGDQFMKKGHRILKRLHREKDVPPWVMNNSLVQKILLRSFPNLLTDPKQREQAGRWLRVIDLYFRQSWSRTDIAAELKIPYSTINTLVRNILRVGEGRSANGSGLRGRRRGRPIKRARLGGLS